MKKQCPPRESLEKMRKTFNGLITALICTGALNGAFAILCGLTDILDGHNALMLAPANPFTLFDLVFCSLDTHTFSSIEKDNRKHDAERRGKENKRHENINL